MVRVRLLAVAVAVLVLLTRMRDGAHTHGLLSLAALAVVITSATLAPAARLLLFGFAAVKLAYEPNPEFLIPPLASLHIDRAAPRPTSARFV